MLHLPVWTETPGQRLPPFIGAGRLQALLRDLIPPPQVRLHLEYAVHWPHAPWTINIEIVCEKMYDFDFDISIRMYLTLINLFQIFVPGGGLVTTVGGRTFENKIKDAIYNFLYRMFALN